MNNKCQEKIIVNKDSLRNYRKLSLGLENCENFDIDISDILDISCEITKNRRSEKDWYDSIYHTTDGYILISSRAKDTLSDFAYSKKDGYIPSDYDENEHKLCHSMSMCDDMCSFSLQDTSGRWKHIYVPYNALENAVGRSEIDYANCPSFRILDNGDMEIRFGKLSKNPIIPRNNYAELVKGWGDVLGDFNPKVLKLKVNSCNVEYDKDTESFVVLCCTILNKKKKNEKVIFILNEFDKLCNHISGKTKTARADMSKLCNGNIYFGIDDYFWASCQSCEVIADESTVYDDD